MKRWSQIVSKGKLCATLIPISPTRTTSTTLRTWSSSDGFCASIGAMRPRGLNFGTSSTQHSKKVSLLAMSFKSFNAFAISRLTWTRSCSKLCPTQVRRLQLWLTIRRFRATSKSSWNNCSSNYSPKSQESSLSSLTRFTGAMIWDRLSMAQGSWEQTRKKMALNKDERHLSVFYSQLLI